MSDEVEIPDWWANVVCFCWGIVWGVGLVVYWR